MARVTLDDVAKRAGVSRSTVSLVLRGNSRISPATASKVRAAMKDLDYVYDRAAANLRQSQTMTVALILTEVGNPFFAELTMAIEGVLREAGYTLFIGYSRDETQVQEQLLAAMIERRVDGVLLLPAAGTTAEDLTVLSRYNIPWTLLTRHLGTLDDRYIGPNNYEAGRLLGTHLRTIGVEDVVLLGGPAQSSARPERLAGLVASSDGSFAIEESSQEIYSATSSAAGSDALAQLLGRGSLPDCIVAYNDIIAVGVLDGLRQRGFQPGSEVAVASFDDIEFAAQQVPPLTSVATHADEVGQASAERILSMLAGTPPDAPVLITPTLQVRSSTGAWRPRRIRQ